MSIISKAKKSIKRVISLIRAEATADGKVKDYNDRFKKYSFLGDQCRDARQYEAVITRWYHTVEKGLSYMEFRPGFGRDNIAHLITAMENYASDGYDIEAFFYKTALSALQQYIKRNHEYNHVDIEVENRINTLPGSPNNAGGAIFVSPLSESEVQMLGYKEFALNRHSFRHFAKSSVNIQKVIDAIVLAQSTPSACNRQGWKARIIVNRDIIQAVCANQNGNRGFGQEFDKIIIVTGDVRCFYRSRELYQVYIDGGMYAENILNALHYYHVASIPLSASLTSEQEANIRSLLNLHDAEVPIMFIGVGNYPEDSECLVARSERKPSEFEVVE